LATEKTTALVLRTTDFSETSRVVVLWTRDFGKVRALAKGGRRLRSAFEVALDLLNLCDIVLIRKASDALDLLTEARLRERFVHLRSHLQAYYAACLMAEILSICAQENDPHPQWFEETISALRQLSGEAVYPTLLQWEVRALREVGLQPVLDRCVLCKQPMLAASGGASLTWSALAGGVVCSHCHVAARGRRQVSAHLIGQLQKLACSSTELPDPATCLDLLDLLHDYWMQQLGVPLRLAIYFQPIRRDAGKPEGGHGYNSPS
jgi:DNA repair protein RecO (recombination protein O)